MESTIKELIKRNQSKLQFGFTKNVDYRACSILRETAVNYNSIKGKTTLILAVDVSNAFSRTQRECQLYELWRTGCRLGVFLYCLGQYKNTFTVIRYGSEYSPLILELQGSKQGGKLSAGDFVVYNSSWSRCIEEALIGLKVEGHFCGAFVCADDSLSCTTSIAELIAVSYIYDFFKSENDVEFAFAKTILNIFNNEKVKKLLQELNEKSIWRRPDDEW